MGKKDNELFDLDSIFGESANTNSDDIMKLDLFGEGADGVGVSETPSGKPYDAAAIKVPKGEVITAETYNSALAALKKSFKEGYEIMGMLENAVIVEGVGIEAKQDSFTEAAIDKAMFESFTNGPYFEAAADDNKYEIKRVVSKVEDGITPGRDEYALLPSSKLQRLFARAEDLKARSWQSVGVFYCKPKELTDALSYYSNKYKEELGDFTFNAAKLGYDTAMTNPHIRSTWGWGLVAMLFLPGSLITGFIGSQIAGMIRANGMKEKRGGIPYLLIVSSEKEKVADIKITLTKEDIAKVEKKLKEEPKSKDEKEFKEFVEFYAAES